MAVFLTTSLLSVLRPTVPEVDSHGWALSEGRESVGEWPGNVQERLPTSDPRASDGGGAGPYDPAVQRTADVYLDPDAQVLKGDLLDAGDGVLWLVNAVRPVGGPLPPFGAVLVADCTLWEL